MIHDPTTVAFDDLLAASRNLIQGKKTVLFVEMTPQRLKYLRKVHEKLQNTRSLESAFRLLENEELDKNLRRDCAFGIPLLNALEQEGSIIIPIDNRSLLRERTSSKKDGKRKTASERIEAQRKAEEKFSSKIHEVMQKIRRKQYSQLERIMTQEDLEKLKQMKPDELEFMTFVGFNHAQTVTGFLKGKGINAELAIPSKEQERIYREWLKTRFLLWASKHERRTNYWIGRALQRATLLLLKTKSQELTEQIIEATFKRIKKMIQAGTIKETDFHPAIRRYLAAKDKEKAVSEITRQYRNRLRSKH
jgi:hypothetical protein